jgi:serine/threonine protein kinase
MAHQQEHPERDLLAGNPRYKKLQDLNEGTFGVVMLAYDTYTKEQVWNVLIPLHPDIVLLFLCRGLSCTYGTAMLYLSTDSGLCDCVRWPSNSWREGQVGALFLKHT